MRSADGSSDVPWWLATILTLAGAVVVAWLSIECAWWGHEWALWALIGGAGVVSVGLLFDIFGIGKRAPADTD
jgi:hypothetical protein